MSTIDNIIGLSKNDVNTPKTNPINLSQARIVTS